MSKSLVITLLFIMLSWSFFFNYAQFTLLVDNENERLQYEEAIQYLGNDCIQTESKIASGLCLERLW